MKSTTVIMSAIIGTLHILGVSAGTRTVAERQDGGTGTSPGPAVQSPSEAPLPGAVRSQGCFTSSANMTSHDVENMSSGVCYEMCRDLGFWTMALRGESCLCGYVYPPRDTRTDDGDCNYPCPAYGREACGALDPERYSVFNVGIRLAVSYQEPESSSTTRPASTSSTAAPTSTAPAQTSSSASASAAPTEEPQNPENDNGDENGGPNVAAIAAGVVGGLVAMAAIAGGFWFHMRRKRNAEIEEEHRRNAAVNAFISGAKPPGSSGNLSISDSRLEPGFATRRLSDGSIADNQDYSRKILRVTNA